jgi:1,4-alpha-glucan branching enzyme
MNKVITPVKSAAVAPAAPPKPTVIPAPTVIKALLDADCADTFGILGLHADGPDGTLVVRTLQPDADSVTVLDAGSGESIADLEKIHPDGLFVGLLTGRTQRFAYRLRLRRGQHQWDIHDPYGFLPVLGEMDLHLLAEGRHQRAYDRYGAHLMILGGVSGVAFAVWAPNAKRVAVVGEFNNWDGRRHGMRCHPGAGVWEIFIPDIGEGVRYKFEVKNAAGVRLPLKMDPFSFATEMRPETASIVSRVDNFAWDDAEWMATRAERGARDAPISVYEVHLGSWRRSPDNRFLTYQQLAEQLIPYVKDLGFTHIELLPISEHPLDASWGYQPIGLFAPTSRFGGPPGFKYFVEACHKAGIGVIVDWVPAHFPSDEHGLAQFDGTALYEHADPRQGFHRDWNTLIYNYGRYEVANFLLSNALFWLDTYHIDGLRVDAVASMLYLDYSRQEGQWIPNEYGGRENLDAIAFLRRLNEEVYGQHPGAITIAEESTAWPGVSRPVYLGGLGFGYKWNMGWMHDTLTYVGRDPVYRRFHHNEITFGLLYAFSENFMLPLSHDEVVHGKRSLLGRMPGDAWRQFATLRAYYGFLWTHPGKKLLFMGGEFAQGHEWNFDAGLDWHLLDIHWHAGVQRLVGDLNRLYQTRPALHQADCDSQGFAWIQSDDAESSIYAYLRRAADPAIAPLVVVCNFTPLVRQQYRLGVPKPGFYAEILNTDAETYGGSNVSNRGGVHTQALPWLGQPYSLTVTVPPLATVIFELSQ